LTAKKNSRNGIRRLLWMVPILGAFWLVLSGHFEPLLLTLGAISAAVVCGMAWRGEFYLHRDVTLRFVLRLPGFLLWLAWQVFVSALGVVRKVWSPRLRLRPIVDEVPAQGLPELAQVVYANAITQTPGTLTLDVDDDRILVHSLDAAGIDELQNGAMLRQIRRLGGRR